MYDKVNMFLPIKKDTQDISRYLSDWNESSGFGWIKNIKVSVTGHGIFIAGSLSRFLYGCNIYPLNTHSTKESISMLSDCLHVDIMETKVTGLEFGGTFAMSEKPQLYFKHLGDMPRMKRSPYWSETLYYKPEGKRISREYIFYDKLQDMQVKKMRVPDGFEDLNLLRFEMRLKNRLCTQLKMDCITGSTLCNKEFYRLLKKRYQQSYFNIRKLNKIKYDSMDIKDPKDALNVLFARLISESNPDIVNTFIDDLKRNQVFDDAKYYSRLKKMIQDKISRGSTAEKDNLIRELDDAVKNACANM